MDNNFYVQVLLDTLRKKCEVLQLLDLVTKKQSELLKVNPFDMDKFDETIEQKQLMIEELDQLDNGFETVYQKLAEEFKLNKIKYKTQIEEAKIMIQKITDYSVDLQAREMRNKEKLELVLKKKKEEIRMSRMGGNTISNYQKNMLKQHQSEQAYFLDRKN